MAGTVQNYDLDKFGVNVDKSEIELKEGELREAQNAIPDTLGHDGGITKRPGLVPITSDMGDAVLGGIGVPFALRVSTINGTTLSDDPGPGGQPGSAPSPGGTPPPGSASGSGAPGSGGSGGAGVPLITTIWHRRESTDGTSGSTGLGKGSWASFDRFTTLGVQTETFDNDPSVGNPLYFTDNGRTKNLNTDGVNFSASHGLFFAGVTAEYLTVGAPSSMAVLNNKLYYSQETKFDTALGETIASQVRSSFWVVDFDRSADPGTLLPSRVSHLASEATQSNTIIVSMLAANGQVYFTTSYIANFGGNIWGGSVFYYDPDTGAYGKLGTNFTTEAPYSLAWHSGKLWLGTWHRNEGTVGNVYSIVPPKIQSDQDANQATPVAWTLDHAMATGTGVLSLCSYQGQLYAGNYIPGAGTTVEVRSPLGAWSASDTIAGGVVHQSMGLIVFQGNLYYSTIVNSGLSGSLIRKYNGTSWSTVLTSAYVLTISWIVENTLMFGGGGAGLGVGLVSSADGTTWVDRTANLPNNTGTTLAGSGVAVVTDYE